MTEAWNDDLDGDKDLDVVVGEDDSICIWINNGSGFFQASLSHPLFAVPGPVAGGKGFSVALGDLDNDDDLDIFVGESGGRGAFDGDRMWLNDGDGSFSVADQTLETLNTTGVGLADLDSDGDLDALVIHDSESHPSSVLLNDGRGVFGDSGQTFGTGFSLELALGDIDGDGDMDAVIGKSHVEDSATEVWLNDGNARFIDGGLRLLPLDPGKDVVDVELGDIDGDNDVDILVTVENSSVSVWRNETAISEFQHGDASHDFLFDQLDIILVLQAGTYLTSQPTDWSEGDWNCDGVFDQLDIVAALQTGNYLQGPYAISRQEAL